MALIFLSGMTGAGKTTVGARLAARLHLPFIDTDREIENRAERSIRAIFAESGEQFFRDLEAEVIRDIATRERGVVALGGGALENPESFALVSASCQLVYLEAPVELLVERLRGMNHRPLLAGVTTDEELHLALETMLARREARYRATKYIVTIGREQSVEDVVDAICLKLGVTWTR